MAMAIREKWSLRVQSSSAGMTLCTVERHRNSSAAFWPLSLLAALRPRSPRPIPVLRACIVRGWLAGRLRCGR